MKEIEMKLSLEEINLIMEALGNLPFVKVYQLIGKIQDQAGAQIQPGDGQAQTMLAPAENHVQKTT